MRAEFLVLVADRFLADSELFARSMPPGVGAKASRPGDLSTMELDSVDLLLLDADVDEEVFLEACDRASCLGLLYSSDSSALRKRAGHRKVRITVSRSATLPEAQHLVVAALRGRDQIRLPRPREDDRELPALSRRETEVLRLMAQGLANRDIATQLSISTHTVRTHVQSLLTKFDRGSRVSAVGAARQAGLL